MKNEIQNNWINRLFLLSNQLANNILGLEPQNFLQLIIEEDKGVYANSQMTRFFYRVIEQFADATSSEYTDILGEWMESDLVNLKPQEITKLYEDYVVGQVLIVSKDN